MFPALFLSHLPHPPIQDQVRYYEDRLLGFEPEGVQAVREGEARMQKEQGSVPQQDDFYVLAFWKRSRYFFQQHLERLTGEDFNAIPHQPTVSEAPTETRAAFWALRHPALEHAVEGRLRTIPGELCCASPNVANVHPLSLTSAT